jgi:hypothetical protein
MVLFRQFGRLRRVTCVEELHCPGNPSASRGIPVAPDARERVETVRAGSATTKVTGHCVTKVVERETVRPCGMANRRRRGEITRPLACWRVVTKASTCSHRAGLSTPSTPSTRGPCGVIHR